MDLEWLTANPWLILGMVLLGVLALIAAAWAIERRARRAYEHLSETGEPAEATVLSARDSGWRTNGRTHIAFELEVRRPGHPPYRARTKLQIHRPWSAIPYQPGQTVQVRVDPERPERVVIADASPALGGAVVGDLLKLDGLAGANITLGTVSSGQLFIVNGKQYTSLDAMDPEVRAAYEQAMGALNTSLDAMDPGARAAYAQAMGALNTSLDASAPDTRERLRQLDALLDEGLISAAEYQTQRARILEQL